mmetsp:Transcript_23569/g.93230  ORF Transcript_23569/g.93230 Transcript_23569/m.93230 type:complete len:181 (-) Transcript_23569:61-603(-)
MSLLLMSDIVAVDLENQLLASFAEGGPAYAPVDLDLLAPEELEVESSPWSTESASLSESSHCSDDGDFLEKFLAEIEPELPVVKVEPETVKPVEVIRPSNAMATCPICHSNFFRKYEMIRHLKATHYRIRPHQCKYCKKSFARTCHLNVHIKNVHMKRDKKKRQTKKQKTEPTIAGFREN